MRGLITVFCSLGLGCAISAALPHIAAGQSGPVNPIEQQLTNMSMQGIGSFTALHDTAIAMLRDNQGLVQTLTKAKEDLTAMTKERDTLTAQAKEDLATMAALSANRTAQASGCHDSVPPPPVTQSPRKP